MVIDWNIDEFLILEKKVTNEWCFSREINHLAVRIISVVKLDKKLRIKTDSQV